MKTVTKFAAISMEVNPENGEVTLFVSNESWGPVVTGKNLAEAKAKMKEAFGLAMIANTFCSHINTAEINQEEAQSYKQELNKINHTLDCVM